MQTHYELNLPPEVPRYYTDHTGHKRFNRGTRHLSKGYTYDELYGPERSAEIRQRQSASMKGHKFSPDRRPSRGYSVIQILPDATVIHHRSMRSAAASAGVVLNAIKQRIARSSNRQGRWFLESDAERWQSYLASIKLRNQINNK